MNTRSTFAQFAFPMLMLTGILAGSETVAAEPEAYPMLSGSGLGRLSYTNQADGPAIAGYAARPGTEIAAPHARIVYVDQAYGQAIYSYPRVAPDITTAFNVEYIDPGFGQAIYSYPRVGLPEGSVKILDIISAPLD